MPPIAVAHRHLRKEAAVLAGGLADLAQRATVYHHLYVHSGRNHLFPLLAAHGALWARGYFTLGMRAGRVAAWRHAANPARRSARLGQLAAFADAFREINRRVCVETYTAYHLARTHGDAPGAAALIPPSLLDQLNACHAARRSGRALSSAARKDLFQAFFLWEQETIVGPAVDRAFATFDWPEVRAIARRPRIAFAYIPLHAQFRFTDFTSQPERIARGLQAFDLAERAGTERTEAALRHYAVLPQSLFNNAGAHFAHLRETALARALVTQPATG